MAYLPNELNSNLIYTYDVKISMVNPLNISEEVFIAQNASDASLNISSITHNHVLGQSLTRHSYSNTFDIILYEPNNVSFFQKILTAATQLGIQNHINASYKIEISFPARNSAGGPANQFRNAQGTTPITYYVKFLKADLSITERGSEYTIMAVESNSTGYYYINSDVKYTATYKASNVNEALSELEEVLNTSAEIHNSTNVNSFYPDTYVIRLADDTASWGSWAFEINENTQNAIGDKLIFNITNGTKISDHIGVILNATTEFKEIQTVQGGSAIPVGQPTTDTGSIGLKYGYKVITKVKDLDFDPLRGDYKKQITFIIKKHIIPEMIIDANELQLAMSDSTYQRTLLKEYFDTGLLRKKYDYLYTGKNTEVINFDMKLQHSYYMISPVFGGQISSSNLRNTTDLSGIVENLSNAKTEYTRARANLLNSFVQKRGVSDRQVDEYNEAVDQIEAASKLWKNAQTPVPSYQSDVIPDGNSYVPENDDQAVALVRLGGVQTNMDNSADLLEIELTIRGDPYWLGNPTGDDFFSENAAPYTLGGPMFFLNINLPNTNNESGQSKPSPEFYISGVYKVISVISEFRDGKFVQFLKAIRMVKILTDVVYDSLQNGEVTGPVTSLTPARQDPSTAPSGGGGSSNPPPAPRSSGGGSSTRSSGGGNTTPLPGTPSNVVTTEAATDQNMVPLDTTILIGTAGQDSRAILRSPDNSYTTVEVGDTYEGRTVQTIETGRVSFDDGSVLSMPPG